MPENFRDPKEVPLQRKIHWVLVILALFFLGLLVDYLFLHLLFKERRHVSPAPITAPATDTGGGDTTNSEQTPQDRSVSLTPPPMNRANAAVSAAPSSDRAVKEFQQEIAKCFGAKSPYTASATADEFIQKVLAANPVAKTQFEVENTHLRLKDGSVRRIHLIESDRSNGRSAREVRYFRLDAEGLPVAIPLPEKDRVNPSETFLASLKKDATVEFHQVKENKFLTDGSNISMNTINDRIFEFQLFGKNTSFSCREIDCRCQ